MRSYHQRFSDRGYTCECLTAWDALEFLPKVMELFPEEEIEAMTTEEGREAMRSDPEALYFLAGKERFSDAEFLLELFKRSKITCDDKSISNIDDHFEDVFSLYEVLSWVVECSYVEALSRPFLVIPETIKNADKILKHSRPPNKPEEGPGLPHQKGVPPPNINPWLFSVIASVDKNKRIDWELLHKFRTEYDLVMFITIWEGIESVKTYEAAELLNSL